jgi:hypothetical protein
MTTKRKAQGGAQGKAVKATADAEQERAERNARIVRGLWEDADMPEFITNAVMAALHLAKYKTGVEFWQVEPGNIMGDDLDMAGLAKLLRVAYGRSDIEVEPEKDLAQLISAVLRHPDTPHELYGAMRREIATMTEPDAVNEDPAVIAVALVVHRSEEEGGAR